jgi:hypothetical protein
MRDQMPVVNLSRGIPGCERSPGGQLGAQIFQKSQGYGLGLGDGAQSDDACQEESESPHEKILRGEYFEQQPFVERRRCLQHELSFLQPANGAGLEVVQSLSDRLQRFKARSPSNEKAAR